MERLSDTRVLKFRPNTLEVVRKDVDLDQPLRMTEALDILENWVKMQAHFTKRDFPRDYLETTLIAAKGLVERAKERLDKLCTFKTLMPEFFTVSDVREEFLPLQTIISTANLPRLTPEHYRVYLSKTVSEENLNSTILFTFYRYLTMISEYFKKFEYCAGFIVILDYSEVNILNLVTKINPMDLRKIITLMTEGYGMRIKGIHVITSSKMVDNLIGLLKQVFSEKLSARIRTHKSIKAIYEFVPKEIMPSDYGGEEKSLKDLHGDWIDTISSEEFLDHFKEMNKAKTNESYRQANKFNESYIGMPGSFRALSVD
ncbi:unnamed protein product [Arctia plantaginis]|uniref:CRAL-TRIO domain-containing protein n=1 Tax=Arctia plantaginis TaxID=874455 RepID=A0A8S1ALP3_ARCPL|nr:unnamed protein product [Arctia plantaginis]